MASTYLSPGVYVEEVDKGTKPIEGVGTSVAAFIGLTEKAMESRNGSGSRSLVNQAVLVTNWNQYTQKFGGFVDGGYLPHAVYGYFANGGGRCYVISLSTLGVSDDPAKAKAAQAALPAAGDGKSETLLIKAREGGPKGNDISVSVQHENPSAPAPSEEGGALGKAEPGETFVFSIKRGNESEQFPGLTLGSGDNNVETVVNTRSKLITVEVVGRKAGKLAERRPAEGKYALAGGEITALAVSAPQFEGSPAKREGLGGLEALDDVTMVCVPDLMSAYQKGYMDLTGVKAVQTALLNHCERMKYRFAILDAPPGLSPQQIGDWRQNIAGYDSKYGALYYPWISVANPLSPTGAPMYIPPCGHMAGIYARSDDQRGVHKAPANEVVGGAIGLEVNVTKGEQDGLNPMGVNCIRFFPGRGIRVWGARTLTSDPSWRYVNVRRLFNFVEASIERGTQWVVFEPNDEDLWARVRRDVTAFLRLVWRSGALFGSTPEQAFYVKCDEELNPPEVRDVGQLIIEIGMAPTKPAEFVIFRISQWAGPNAEA